MSHVIENLSLLKFSLWVNLRLLALVSISPGNQSRSTRRQSIAFVHCRTIPLLHANLGGMGRQSAIGPGWLVHPGLLCFSATFGSK